MEVRADEEASNEETVVGGDFPPDQIAKEVKVGDIAFKEVMDEDGGNIENTSVDDQIDTIETVNDVEGKPND